MKVLFWVNYFPTVSETFIRNQVVDLINNGIDVSILCSQKDYERQGIEGFEKYDLLNKTFDFKEIIPKSKFEKVNGLLKIFGGNFFSHNRIFFFNYTKLYFLDRRKDYLKGFFLLHYILKNKIGVIHCHFGPNGKEAVFLKKIGVPIKLICTFHGYDIRLGIKNGGAFYNDLFEYADSIISISSFNKKMLLSFGLIEKKIEDLNNGVEISSEIVAKNSNKEVINILSVGRLVEEKGYELALNAISIFHKKYPKLYFHYHIIGSGDFEAKLKKKCNDLDLDKIVTFHLSQNSDYVKRKMLEADLFFLPSITEAIPTVILEAQSFSLPVIATNVGSVKDLVVNDVTGILSDIEENHIVNSLKKMFDNKEKWEEYGFNARKNIIINYDRKILVQRLINIYNKNI